MPIVFLTAPRAYFGTPTRGPRAFSPIAFPEMRTLPHASRRPMAAVAVLLTLSCGGDSPSGPSGGGNGPDLTTVTQVAVTPSMGTVNVGATVQFTASATNGTGGTVTTAVTWSSATPAVATVSGSGLVTGVAPGSAVITAAAGGRSATATVTVVDPTPPAAPRGLTAVAVSHTEVDLGWTDNATNETGFVIEREPAAGGGAFAQVGTVGADVSAFRDSGLTPATAYRYRVRATNANGDSDHAGPAEVTTHALLAIATAALDDGTLNQAYAMTLTATGGSGTYQWSLQSGALPAGLALSGEGVISGTPTAVDSAVVTLAVASGGQTATKAFTLVVRDQIQAPEVVTSALPAGAVGVAYSQKLEAHRGDGTYSWSLAGGSLPAGLNLAADGTVSGTPTAAGTATFLVQVQSAGMSGTGTVSLTINAPVVVTTTSLPAAQVGSAYSATLTASGGDGSTFTWSVTAGALPAGLSLAGSTGAITGTPTTEETANFTVQATNGGQSGTKALSITVAAAPSPGYNIELVYLTSLSATHQAAFENAKARWESIITADAPDNPALPKCNTFHPATPGPVDDLVIFVTVDSIDGAGGTVGQAGPCYIRGSSNLPLTGAMIFDEADLNGLGSVLESVILHEMGHVLGIGTVWESAGLLSGQCTVDPIFTGAGARTAFNSVGGSAYVGGGKVPVENTGTEGDGSNCAHWRETVFGKELMTPVLTKGAANPLSTVTVQSLADLGYTVTNAGADGYALPAPSPAGAAAVAGEGTVLLHADVAPQPILRVMPDGRVEVVRPARTSGRR